MDNNIIVIIFVVIFIIIGIVGLSQLKSIVENGLNEMDFSFIG